MDSAEPIESNPVLTEARAKIIWGDTAESVRVFLTANGVAAAEADAKVKQFVRERNAELRKIGLYRILIGAPLLLISFGLSWFILHDEQTTYHRTSYRAFGFLLLMGFFGLWKLVGGLIFLLRPQSDDESIPDIDE